MTALLVFSLAGCSTATVSDRTRHPPNHEFSSTNSAEDILDCIQAAWVVKAPAEVLRMPTGYRLVHGNSIAVEDVTDIERTADGSLIRMYLRSPRGY